MIRRLLIANRGEIAARIARTARGMGIETVAVYSDADAGALHVAAADHAVRIGPAAPSESYLDGAKVIAAARESGADAIHPGYGFLSENPGFVEAVEAAGIAFVGPPASAIRAMGLKDAAKRAMAEAGVPVVPGYHGEAQDDDHLEGAAEAIGYPVLIKAVAGGGGKGMRRVAAPSAFRDALASCRAEARAAFGDDRVLVEKWIESPRHVEVQVFADARGTVIHLYERDCSLQRRHQKVIEEAPAPGMTAEVRAAMGAAAVRAAEAIGYVGAGTVEFIADGARGLRSDGFWFMEMNTRLQVEHPVTEAITGLDLVEWQLRVAAGEGLPLAQAEVPLAGHAMEARLYAEDPAAGFLPATGRLTHLRFPAGVRVDAGVRAGDAVSPHYDPMIAKVIAHGPDRETARRRLVRALGAIEVAGCVTNIGFLARLADRADFAAGAVDTGLIERAGVALVAEPAPGPRAVAAAALAVARPEAAGPQAGFTLWAPLLQEVRLLHAGEEIVVGLSMSGPDKAQLVALGATVAAEQRPGGWWLDGSPAPAAHVEGARVVVFDSGPVPFAVPDPLARGGAAGPSGDVVEAPMPGLVRALLVAPGDTVAAGQRLAVLEAMKMEHALAAPRDGSVAECLVAEGAQVEAGAALIRLAPEGGPETEAAE
ncbi:MAG: biotin carboxylase N-terminal domain-containing protein [Paracoccaceae bacterium]|jgi:3-methylcrotonyl-CoA carboxylase alpha subunit|nr:biotin carboxylase N-terminal domain-containing protein [Paracoccaceae bacterium]